MWLGGRGLPNMSKAPDSIPTSTKKGGGGGVVQWVKVFALIKLSWPVWSPRATSVPGSPAAEGRHGHIGLLS